VRPTPRLSNRTVVKCAVSKEELFRAAVDDALDLFAAVLDELTAGLDDPAHVFAQGFRLTGRLHRAQPS
jgi:hypothetical protein